MDQQKPATIADVTTADPAPICMAPIDSPLISETGQIFTGYRIQDEKNLFIGGLKAYITKEQIWLYFNKYSLVKNVSMKINGKTRCNKGFAFVNFADSSVIEKILRIPHFFGDRKVDCKLSLGYEYNRTEQEASQLCKLFVKKLKKTTNDQKMNKYFSQFGELKNAYVIQDNHNQRSRGYGIVQFANPESANAVMANPDKHFLDNKQVSLSRFQSINDKKARNFENEKYEGPLPPNSIPIGELHQALPANSTDSNHGMASPENSYKQQQSLYEGQGLNTSRANPNFYGHQMSYQANEQHFDSQPGQQFYQHTNPLYEIDRYHDQPGNRAYYDTQPQHSRDHNRNYQNESQDNNLYYAPETYREDAYFYLPLGSRPTAYQMQSHSQGDPTYQGQYPNENVQQMSNPGYQDAYIYCDNRESGTNPEQGQELPHGSAQMHGSYLQYGSPYTSLNNDQSIQFGQPQIWPSDQVAFSGMYPNGPEQPPGQLGPDPNLGHPQMLYLK